MEKNADGSALALTTIGGIPNQQAAGTGGRLPVNGTANYAGIDGTHLTQVLTTIIAAGLSPQAAACFTLNP